MRWWRYGDPLAGGVYIERSTIAPGTRFGRLTVLRRDKPGTKDDRRRYVCRCDCGHYISVRTASLLRNLKPGDRGTQSCGCWAAEHQRQWFVHGLSDHPLYQTWISMHKRCEQQSAKGFKDYGGRGIRVCWHWHRSNPDGLRNFIADMGDKPGPEYSIDRIDNDGDYKPQNCRWATAEQQNCNKQRRKEAVLTLPCLA